MVRIGEDVGRGAAVNRAVATLPPAVGLVAVAPADLVWPDGALDALRAAADPRAPRSCSGPLLRDPDGRRSPRLPPRPAPSGAARDARPDADGPVGWSSALRCCCGAPRWTPSTVSTPAYPGRLDDLDLADRLARAGWL